MWFVCPQFEFCVPLLLYSDRCILCEISAGFMVHEKGVLLLMWWALRACSDTQHRKKRFLSWGSTNCQILSDWSKLFCRCVLAENWRRRSLQSLNVSYLCVGGVCQRTWLVGLTFFGLVWFEEAITIQMDASGDLGGCVTRSKQPESTKYEYLF